MGSGGGGGARSRRGTRQHDEDPRTGAFPRQRRRRGAYHMKSTRVDDRVDRGPRRYELKGRRSGGGQVRATAGRPRGGSGDRGPWRYNLKGRRSDGTRVNVTAGAASGRRRGPRIAALRPEGRHIGDARVDATVRRTTGRQRCGGGATQRQPVARSMEGHVELGNDLHRTCGARASDEPG